MVRPVVGPCRSNGPSVAPAASTDQPAVQSPPAGDTITLTFRLIASLRARNRDVKISEPAARLRWLAMMSENEGAARAAMIPSTAIVIINSTTVNPPAPPTRELGGRTTGDCRRDLITVFTNIPPATCCRSTQASTQPARQTRLGHPWPSPSGYMSAVALPAAWR